MPFASGFGAAHSSGLQNLSRAFSAQSRLRSRLFEDGESARRLRQARTRAHDAFVQRSPREQPAAAAPEPTSLYASSTQARLKTSSSTVVRQDADSGAATTLQSDQLDFRLRSAQLAAGEDGVASLAAALADQSQALGRVLDAAGLLGGFSGDLAQQFLSRIGQALDGLGGDGPRAQATSLDVKIHVESQSVRVENGEDGGYVERRIARIDVSVRFLSLSASGEVQQAQEPLQAGLHGAKGSDGPKGVLSGHGPRQEFAFGGFDVNGDGRFTVDDILALADQTVDLG